MHVSYSSANLISDHCMQSDNVIFDMTECTLHYNNDVIEHVSEVNEYLNYILTIHLSFKHLQQAGVLKFHLKCNIIV